MNDRYRVGCCVALLLLLLRGDGLCFTLPQHPAAELEGQGITLSEVYKLPGRVVAKGENTKPTGYLNATTYLVEELTLPHAVEVTIRGKKKRVTRAYRVTIFGGPFHVRNIGHFIGIGGTALGFGIESMMLDSVSVTTFDRSLIRDGATLTVDHVELPEKLKLKKTK